jgi:superfamily I DNA and/or RNA helicase
MLVEEAGQVLEAHILGSLVPSVEHLILIGDPLQLRPTLNNYGELVLYSTICYATNLIYIALSMDNKRGKQLFKFDMSLMERLATNGLSMSQLNVQRRM